MKALSIIISLLCLITLFASESNSFANEDVDKNITNVEKLLNLFVDKREISNEMRSDLLAQYEKLSPKDKEDIEGVSFDLLSARFSKYIQAKKMDINPAGSAIINANDFKWEYIKEDFDFWAVASIVSSDATVVNQVASGSTVIVKGFDIKLEPMKEDRLVIPVKNREIIIYASGAKGNLAWHAENIKQSEAIVFHPAFSEGVELYIKSNPSNADIYFNNKKYYQRTDTTCVRKPGECTLLIKKNGYQDWVKRYDFEKGEIYNINIDLVPITTQ